LENPHVDLLRYPTVALDLDAVIAVAKQTGTVLEIDASPEPLDLCGEGVRKAVEAGVRLAIDSGADEPEQLARVEEFGVAVARRGWARRCDVLNALPVNQCLAQLKDRWGFDSGGGCS